MAAATEPSTSDVPTNIEYDTGDSQPEAIVPLYVANGRKFPLLVGPTEVELHCKCVIGIFSIDEAVDQDDADEEPEVDMDAIPDLNDIPQMNAAVEMNALMRDYGPGKYGITLYADQAGLKLLGHTAAAQAAAEQSAANANEGRARGLDIDNLVQVATIPGERDQPITDQEMKTVIKLLQRKLRQVKKMMCAYCQRQDIVTINTCVSVLETQKAYETEMCLYDVEKYLN